MAFDQRPHPSESRLQVLGTALLVIFAGDRQMGGITFGQKEQAAMLVSASAHRGERWRCQIIDKGGNRFLRKSRLFVNFYSVPYNGLLHHTRNSTAEIAGT